MEKARSWVCMQLDMFGVRMVSDAVLRLRASRKYLGSDLMLQSGCDYRNMAEAEGNMIGVLSDVTGATKEFFTDLVKGHDVKMRQSVSGKEHSPGTISVVLLRKRSPELSGVIRDWG